jgi:hypothetical protein
LLSVTLGLFYGHSLHAPGLLVHDVYGPVYVAVFSTRAEKRQDGVTLALYSCKDSSVD